MTHRRRKGAPISKPERQWARLLYQRGLKLQEIADKTGISVARVGGIAKDENWKDGLLPPYDSNDFSDAILDFSFKTFLNILSGEEEDVSRAILDVKNLAATRRDVEELIFAVGQRHQIESLKLFATQAAADGRADVAEYLQGLYDAKVGEL